MARYRVVLEVEATSIEMAGLTAAELRSTYSVVHAVTVAVAPLIGGGPRWSVALPAERGCDVSVAFDGDAQRGMVAVTEPAVGTVAAALRPGTMAQLVRALQSFPLDLMDTMAEVERRDRRPRKAGEV